MGFLSKLKGFIFESNIDDNTDVEDVLEEIEEEVKEEVKNEEVKKEVKVEAVVKEEVKEVEVKKEEVKEVKKEEKKEMQIINVKSDEKKNEGRRAKKEVNKAPQRTSYVLDPIISPIHGKKEESKVIITPEKKVVKRKNEEVNPLTTVISPYFGRNKKEEVEVEVKEEVVEEKKIEVVEEKKVEVKEEVVVNVDVDKIDFVENEDTVDESQELTITLDDLLGDSKVDDTVQISLFKEEDLNDGGNNQ